MPKTCFVTVGKTEDFAEKSFRCILVGGTPLVICRFRDEFFALHNQCSHALASFDDGRMRGYRLMCPLHGASFDIRDGSVTGAPATQPVDVYPVRVVEGVVEVDVGGDAG